MKFKYCFKKSVKTTIQPKTKDELKKIIEYTIKEQGYNCNLNFIDTSKITDMSRLFCGSKFNGDISKWDVSNVKDMSWMFKKSHFEISPMNLEPENIYLISSTLDTSQFDMSPLKKYAYANI